MATTTKLLATNALYGNTGNGKFTNSAATHMYVGKYGSDTFRSRMTFNSLLGVANIGNARIAITKVLLYIRRNDGGPATVTAGCSPSSDWNAALAATGSASHAASTGWKSIDITACASAIAEYSGNWYVHLRSSDYIRYNGTGSDYQPYLMVTWEYVAATIKGNKDSVELGSSVTYTITPEVSGETHTLQYYVGDASGTIATKAGNSISWTPPASLATEITDDDTGMVEIRLTAYDASGNVQRTERYYQTVTVPSSVKPSINSVGAALKNGLSGYGLTGRSYLTIAPVINMNNAYAASITYVEAEVNGRIIRWTSLTETSAGVFTGAAADTSIFNTAGSYTVTLTVMDSRGRTATATQTFTICAYALPVISLFSVERYEPVYDANEQISGYQASDLGGYVWVNLAASISAINPAGTQLNTLRWSITAVNAATGATRSASGTGAQSVNIAQNRTLLAAAVGPEETWNYTVTVTDSTGLSSVWYSTVLPARASLAVKPGSVGIGCIPGGSPSDPQFRCAYPATFDKTARFNGGIHGHGVIFSTVSNSSSALASGTTLTTPSVAIAESGVYLCLVTGSFSSGNASKGYRLVRILVNGSEVTVTHYQQSPSGWPNYQVIDIYELNAGDTVSGALVQTSEASKQCSVSLKVVRLS